MSESRKLSTESGQLHCQPPPPRIAGPRGLVAIHTIPNEVDIHVVLVCRPVHLEIIQETTPIWWDAVDFEAAQRQGERVLDAYKRRWTVAELDGEPLGETPSRPILARAGRGLDFRGQLSGRSSVEPQPWQAAR